MCCDTHEINRICVLVYMALHGMNGRNCFVYGKKILFFCWVQHYITPTTHQQHCNYGEHSLIPELIETKACKVKVPL